MEFLQTLGQERGILLLRTLKIIPPNLGISGRMRTMYLGAMAVTSHDGLFTDLDLSYNDIKRKENNVK